MKFISSNSRSLPYLLEWSGTSELIIGSYFFWLAGTDLQKNQEGLLRSLLLQILTKRPGLIPRVFPHLYKTMMAREFADNSSPQIFFPCEHRGCQESFEKPKQLEIHQQNHSAVSLKSASGTEQLTHKAIGRSYETLTLTEMKDALMLLSQETSQNLKICLFVDGLDEYSGSPHEIISLFKNAASQSPSLKVILSSRPEPEFVEAFCNSPRLRLQDLTKGDIQTYVYETLFSHSKMKQLQHKSPRRAESLVSAVMARASGVFLWVILVVRSLLEGLSDGNYPEELEEVLESYPEELRHLYQHMFERMKPAHRIQASKLFQCICYCMDVEKALPAVLRISFMDKEDPQVALSMPLRLMTQEEIKERSLDIDARLRSRCCGLFEVHKRKFANGDRKLMDEWEITFLHRSVSDFLRDPDFRTHIKSESRETHFNPFECLLSSTLFYFKSKIFFEIASKKQDWEDFIPLIKAFFTHCQRCDEDADFDGQSSYVEEFDIQLTKMWHRRFLGKSKADFQSPWAASIAQGSFKSGQDPLISISGHYGLSKYLRSELRSTRRSSIFSVEEAKNSTGHWLIGQLICRLVSSESSDLRKQHILIIEELLKGGFDVISKVASIQNASNIWDRDPWQILVYVVPLKPHIQSLPWIGIYEREETLTNNLGIFEDWVKVLMLFVNSGADIDVMVFQGKTARKMILERLPSYSKSRPSFSTNEQSRADHLEEQITNALRDIPVKVRRQRKTKIHPESLRNGIVTEYSATNARQIMDISSVDHSVPETQGHKIAPCSRCKAIEKLTKELGFSAQEVISALDEAGVGTDILGLSSWILRSQDEKSNAFGGLPRRKDAHPLRESKPQPCASTSSTANQGHSWSTVAKRVTSPIAHIQNVPGAEYIIKPAKNKSRSRRGKTSQIADLQNDHHSNMPTINGIPCNDVINLAAGKFNWSFEADDSSQKHPTLSLAQIEALKDCISAILS